MLFRGEFYYQCVGDMPNHSRGFSRPGRPEDDILKHRDDERGYLVGDAVNNLTGQFYGIVEHDPSTPWVPLRSGSETRLELGPLTVDVSVPRRGRKAFVRAKSSSPFAFDNVQTKKTGEVDELPQWTDRGNGHSLRRYIGGSRSHVMLLCPDPQNDNNYASVTIFYKSWPEIFFRRLDTMSEKLGRLVDRVLDRLDRTAGR